MRDRNTWGKYRVTAHLSNGRQMKCHAVSYAEGQRQLNEYIKLSTATITRLNLGVTENDSANLDKKIVPTVVYPAYAKLTVGDVRPDGNLNYWGFITNLLPCQAKRAVIRRNIKL